MISLDVIATARTPYNEKFGVPRQPGLVAAKGRIELLPPYDSPQAVDGLAEFSHVWLTFLFHEVADQPWRNSVRPPRLGGNRRVGVFASRSPYRPNHLGLSLVSLHSVQVDNGVCLHVSGIDLVDGTPIVDIKPYIAYADSVPAARCGYADTAPSACQDVVFSDAAATTLAGLASGDALYELIAGVLAQDPRPAFHDEQGREYGVRLAGCNVRWRQYDDRAEVISVAADSSAGEGLSGGLARPGLDQ